MTQAINSLVTQYRSVKLFTPMITHYFKKNSMNQRSRKDSKVKDKK